MGNQAHRTAPGLILVKHGAPLITPGAPPSGWPLAEEGREQARRIAARLAPFAPAAVVSSLELKAVETARIIAEVFALAPACDACLGEQRNDAGPFTDAASFQSSVARMFAEPGEVVMGEESADEAYLRFSAALDRQSAAVTDGPLVAVCHGRVIALWASRRFGFDPFPFWRGLQLGAAVLVREDGPQVVDP